MAPRVEAAGSVVVVDDDASIVALVEHRLRAAGFEVTAFADAGSALIHLQKRNDIDVLLTDVFLEGLGGLDLLATVRERFPHITVLVMTGHGSVEIAVEAMRRGAFDFVLKPLSPAEALPEVLRRAAEHARLVKRNKWLEHELPLERQFEGIVGTSKAMQRLLAMVDTTAPMDVTVLVLGESGTGKELVARAIHRRSARSARPFVAINCAALTDSVLESELFGHVKGAYTGAVGARRGLFEEANGGTLFLDEVGELSLATQVRLLRVLQEGEVRPVGSNDPRKVDVRVVAATHRDLPAAVKANAFRLDLYYRLNVVSLRIPPLRERLEDLPLLALHLAQKHAARLSRPAPVLAPDALETLASHPWEGNVRELENVMQRAVVLAIDGFITSEHLPEELAGPPIQRGVSIPPSATNPLPTTPDEVAPLPEAREAFERCYLLRLMELVGGNVALAARRAEIDRSNFRKLLKKHDIDADSFRDEHAAPRGEQARTPREP